MSIYFVPYIVLESWDLSGSKNRHGPCPQRAFCPVGAMRKQALNQIVSQVNENRYGTVMMEGRSYDFLNECLRWNEG